MPRGKPVSKPKLQTLLKHDFEKLAGSKSPMQNGYVYVPKGDVYITRNCRDFTAAEDKTLYIVYDEKSHERLGLRCPTEVFKQVTANAIATSVKRKDAVFAKDRKHVETARESLVRLFPRIPLDVAEEVLKHGFEKGSGRVGRVDNLESDERVTLAVVAHARHTKTPYDSLLKKMDKSGGYGKGSREKAREAIKDELERVLKSWRALPVRQSPPKQSKSYKSVQKAIQKPLRKTAGSGTQQGRGVQKIKKASRLNGSHLRLGQGLISKPNSAQQTINSIATNTALGLRPLLSQMAQVAEPDGQVTQLAKQQRFKDVFVRR